MLRSPWPPTAPDVARCCDHVRRTSVREANEAKIAPKPVKNVAAPAAAMWFAHNEHLGPPYYVILDPNAINFA